MKNIKPVVAPVLGGVVGGFIAVDILTKGELHRHAINAVKEFATSDSVEKVTDTVTSTVEDIASSASNLVG